MLSDISHPNTTQLSREIPKEILFRVSSDTMVSSSGNIPPVRQDNVKKNKYWFRFPEEWSNRKFKDKVLGIRSIYLLEDWFDIEFDFYINIVSRIPPEFQVLDMYMVSVKNCFIGRNQTLRDVCAYFDKIIHTFIEKYNFTLEYEE
jgi:hypothetical protein